MAPVQVPPRPEARQRITDAAFRLFARKGYSSTSIQDIADAAEVKKAIVYYYFGSKEGLYQSLLTEGAANLKQFLMHALSSACAGGFLAHEKSGNAADLTPPMPLHIDLKTAPPPDPGLDLVKLLAADAPCSAKMAAICETLLALARENRDPVRFFFAHLCAPDTDRPTPTDEKVGPLPRLIMDQIVRQSIDRGELEGDPDDLSRLVLGAVHISILGFLRDEAQEPLPAGLGLRIVRAALRGFLPRPPVRADKEKPASPARPRPASSSKPEAVPVGRGETAGRAPLRVRALR